MKYTKPALSFEQQAQRLIERGLSVTDRSRLVQCLQAVNYYRLSAYWYPLKVTDLRTGAEQFLPGTKFEAVWRRYTFDRQLRLLVMEAIERVEVAVLRTRMVEQFTRLHGPFGYVEPASFSPQFRRADHLKLLAELDNAVQKSKEEFVSRFRQHYADEPNLPLWMAAELTTFGQLFTLFRYLHRAEQQALTGPFDIYPPVFESWLHTLNYIRNVCAHHARLWNRELPIRPLIPSRRHRPDWHAPVVIANDRVFVVLTILHELLREIEPQNTWRSRLESLLAQYPDVPRTAMGFPEDWTDCPIWGKQR